MPRARADLRALHAEADALEPRVARAFTRAIGKLRATMNVNGLAMALAARERKSAERAVLPRGELEAALSPATTILKEAVLRGGRAAGEQLNKALEA